MKPFVASILCCAVIPSAVEAPSARFVEQVVRSTADPRIAVRVDASLPFLGKVERVVMEGRAQSEDFLFAEAREGAIASAFIAHFEHVLPGSGLRFDYPRLRMTRLGGREYLHQSWPEQDWELFRSPEVRALLAQRGLRAPGVWLVDRYVRAADDDRKSEVIFFYLEAAGELPAPIERLRLAGDERAKWDPIDRRLTLRAQRAFTVISD